MIEIKETQKKVENKQMIPYLVKQIDLCGNDSLTIYPIINESSLEQMHKMLAFYLCSQSVEEKTGGGFILQRKENVIIVTGNLQNAIIGLHTLKFISEPTMQKAINNINDNQAVRAMSL